MSNGDDENLTDEQKQLYRKKRVPHKFCPYCGTRNEANAANCANCDKDISWMKVPEPMPYDEPPKQKPRPLPPEQKVITPRAIIVLIIIVAVILAIFLTLYFTTRGKGAELSALPVMLLGVTGLVSIRGTWPGRSSLARSASRCARCSTSTSRRRPS